MKFNWFRRKDEELDAEIRSHLDEAIRDRIERGESPEHARANALREFGNVGLVKEVTREMWGWASLERLGQDLRFGLRMLRKNPGFSLVAILTLALGIGVNTALFSMFYLFDRPLPQTKPGVAVTLEFHETKDDVSYFRASYPEYLHLRDHTAVFAELSASHLRPVVLAGQGAAEAPQQVLAEFVSDTFFSVFDAKLALGRTFTPEETRTPGQGQAIVLSYGFWQSRFGADPNIIGRVVPVNGLPFVVVGVTAREFARFGADQKAGLWFPLTMRGRLYPDTDTSTGMEWYAEANQTWLTLHGRLKPGRSADEARAEISALLGQLAGDHAQRFAKADVRVTPLTILGAPGVTGAMTEPRRIVLAATTIVLLIACLNLASLLLARAATRRREIGIRLCVGASRSRLVRQLMTESLLLAALGGGAVLLLAWWSLQGFLATALLSAWGHADLAELALRHLTPDWRILAFTLLMSLGSCLVFGLVPALRVTRTDLVGTIKDEGAVLNQQNTRSRLRNATVVVQIASCLVLLLAAGLLLRGLSRAQAAEASFNPQQMLLLSIEVRPARYDEARAQQFYQDLTMRLESLPGVQSVTRAFSIPGLESDRPVGLAGETADGNGRRALSNEVAPNYFDTIGSPIIRGRGFTEEERRTQAAVVVVTESMAQQLWPGEDALGKSVLRVRKTPAQVVGIARDAKNIFGEIHPLLYTPIQPSRERESTGRVLVRTSRDAKDLLPMVRTAAQAVDPNLALTINPLASFFAETARMKNTRTASALSLSLGLLALLLAIVGLYGVMAYAVTQRTREIGIRMALGANRQDVLWLVLRQGLWLVGSGIALGVIGGAAISRLLTSLLFGLSPLDPMAYVSVSLCLAAVALVAVYLPARRATKVDPLVALKYE
ncbi:MAG: ADOP family duplicated permease [Blastocatellia bacterium]